MVMKMIRKKINIYDGMLLGFVLIAVGLFAWGWHDMHLPVTAAANANAQSMSLSALAYDLLRTNMRLIIGLFWSFVFAFVAGTWAAKSKHAARFILPVINFMESVPLVGFMTFSIVIFMAWFPHSVMGFESAAIFGVFTGQAWNMALTVYQTLKVIPPELQQMSRQFQMSAWQRYWRIEVPYSLPGLLWNTMVSQSAAWFALVGTEAIAIGAKTVMVPGVGSYIQVALMHKDWMAIIFAISAIIVNIIIFDQFCFRPLVKWCEKFKFERVKTQQVASSWLYQVIGGASLVRRVFRMLANGCHALWNMLRLVRLVRCFDWRMPKKVRVSCLVCWYFVLSFGLVYYGVKLIAYLPHFSWELMLEQMGLTTMRVVIAMLLSLIIFLPLGVWIGLSPKKTKYTQSSIQVMAALPPDIFYPIFAVLLFVAHQHLNWWTIPLIMVGTQWYILFNVIAGVSSLPQGLRDVSKMFSLRGIYYWRKVIIPAIFPYIVTGIISAAGGAWNADITAEVISWGHDVLQTKGLGAFISIASQGSHMSQEALGCVMMCVLVGICIVFVWRPLYRLAETKFNIR